ncbi:MAG TPA: 1-deoxy-D-xylulose-5-phosphate synthase [Candidatus Cloacimonetes bacterium]|nr:1-deoxy-D-xylulose-5-phosphate synthase [Candidatus Cloacimonadota bacterium]
MLETVKSPEEVKQLNIAQLKELCKELRERILQVTSITGGHLAPSLGVVELTVALLKVFDPLKNKIIWDVGHQSYAYKILTERNDEFDKIRQYGGISGFNTPKESKYDAFGVGHSSTSISAALGISVGKELKKQQEKTIVVIGDGALTAGEAFEGLNNTGGLKKDIMVILNDNSMSISKNVGGIHHYLAHVLSGRHYNRLKRDVWDMVQALPNVIKNKIITGARRLEESMLKMFIPNSLFEDLGFRYIGPINGHDLPTVIKILTQTRNNITEPALVHVITKKGKGCEFAEQDATKFHGISSFDRKNGKAIKVKEKPSYSKVFGTTLAKLAEEDKEIVAITAAMCDGTGLNEFRDKFADRFFDVGIAEQHAVTFAAGLAVEEMKPYVAIYSTFLQRAYDQIIHDVALQNLPVRFAIDRGGLVGEDGPTHHGAFDLSYLRCIPNMTIMAPRDGYELEKMLKFMNKYTKGPIGVRYPRGEIDSYDLPCGRIIHGKAEIIQEGRKIAVISIGTSFSIAFNVINKLKKLNIEPYLINARFIKPIDEKLLLILHEKEVENIITIEENAVFGGFGTGILETCNALGLNFNIKRFGLPDEFVTFGDTEILRKKIGLTADNITEYIQNLNGKS